MSLESFSKQGIDIDLKSYHRSRNGVRVCNSKTEIDKKKSFYYLGYLIAYEKEVRLIVNRIII
jgi:hypothetical protein